jgi:hypothetical protein
VALVRIEVPDEPIATIITIKEISEQGTTLAVTRNRSRMQYSETSVLKRATRRHIPEDGRLHRYRRETLKSYIVLTGWALKRRRNLSPVRYVLDFYIP